MPFVYSIEIIPFSSNWTEPIFSMTTFSSTSKFVKTIGVIIEGTHSLMKSKSARNNGCPAFTCSPSFTSTSKPSPFRLNVSIPK